MMSLPRVLPNRVLGKLTIACLLAGPAIPASVFAQAAPGGADGAPAQPAAPVAAAEAPINADLLKAVRDFWHFASVANYDAAKARGEAILGMNADPMEVYRAFESVVRERNARVPAERRIDLYERLLSWQRRAELKDVAPKLIETFRSARGTRRADPSFIEENVKRLSTNRLGYARGLENLRESGELAVPIMLAYLREPAQREHHSAIRVALRDLGVKALHPLTAATYSKDLNMQLAAVTTLGEIGYDNAIPYLVRVVQDNEATPAVKTAATQSLVRLGVSNPAQMNAARLFLDLAEKFYYDRASIQSLRENPTTPVWSWSGDGLSMMEVPSAVFNEVKALQAAEQVVKLDPSIGEAVSLWLAAGYKREVELTEGTREPYWGERPATHVYAVTSGTGHLNPVLGRALTDNSSAVALKAIKSLQEIVGASNLFAGGGNPVLNALSYSDRQVRFEAALTVAGARPQQAFAGADRVIAVLAEAIGQTGKPGVLVVAPSQDELNKQREGLAKNYAVQGGTTADAALNAAGQLSSVDVVIVRENQQDIDRLMAAGRDNVRLGGAAVLVVVASEVASPYAQIAQQNPRVSVTSATDEAGLAAAIENARKKAGSLPMDEKGAGDYALRATKLLGELAAGRNQAFDLTAAQGALLAALDDSRTDLAQAAGDALSMMGTKQAQAGLAAKAQDEKTPDELKVHFLRNLSTNAKFFGNQADAQSVAWLTKLVESSPNAQVRAAAAEAHGALNLPADQVKNLILQPAKTAAAQ